MNNYSKKEKLGINTPVLLIVFNRPESTRRVFDAIRIAKPSRLYISSDGPRAGNSDDVDNIRKVREIVSNIDWPCKVERLFSDVNVGCQFGPRNGIDWLFRHEEQGIILEDDCLPSESFFYFCQEILSKYQNDDRVMSVAGVNMAESIRVHGDYYFSRYPLMWGWATWKRAWMKYDPNLSEWKFLKEQRWLLNMDIGGFGFEKVWSKTFDLTQSLGAKATWWDYQWIYTCWVNNGYTVCPSVNLIQNLGIGSNASATHTSNYHPILSNLQLNDLDFPLSHPAEISLHKEMDAFISKHWFYADWVS